LGHLLSDDALLQVDNEKVAATKLNVPHDCVRQAVADLLHVDEAERLGNLLRVQGVTSVPHLVALRLVN